MNRLEDAARLKVHLGRQYIRSLSARPKDGSMPVAYRQICRDMLSTIDQLGRLGTPVTNSPREDEETGSVVVTKDRFGQIVAVTRQDEEGRILRVISTSGLSPEELAAFEAAENNFPCKDRLLPEPSDAAIDAQIRAACHRDCLTKGNEYCLTPTEIRALFSQTMSLRDIWRAAGGHPGINPTRQDVVEALRSMDAAIDDCDEKHGNTPRNEKLVMALQGIVDAYDFRSELYTSDADCAGHLADKARFAIKADKETYEQEEH